MKTTQTAQRVCFLCKQPALELKQTCCDGVFVCWHCDGSTERKANPINSAAFQRLNELWDAADEKSCQNSR